MSIRPIGVEWLSSDSPAAASGAKCDTYDCLVNDGSVHRIRYGTRNLRAVPSFLTATLQCRDTLSGSDSVARYTVETYIG